MASLGEQDYEMLGRRVVATLGSPPDLNHATAEVAEQERFNPDQIRRLVEFTNTEAFLRQLRGAEDTTPKTTPNPTAEFEPAQAPLVIRIILQRGGNVPGESSASAIDDASSFPDSALCQPSDLSTPQVPAEPGEEDDDDVEDPEDEEAEPVRASRREAAHRALDRVLDRVTERGRQEQFAFDTKAAALVAQVRRHPHVMGRMERVAYSLYADNPVGITIMSELREALRLPALSDRDVQVKRAAAPTVYLPVPELSAIDELTKHACAARAYRRAEEYLRDHLR